MRSWRQFIDDPRLAGFSAVAAGTVKGAVIGLALGKLGLGVAAGLAAGTVAGAGLAWRARRAQARSQRLAGKVP